MEHDFSTVPEDFVTDGVPDFAKYRSAYDTALGASGGNIDAASLPEQFVTDGKPDLGAYKMAFDDASAFKARADERMAALPKDADGYTFTVPEEFNLPEGFTPPEGFKLELKDDDPRIPALKALALEHGLDQSVLDGFAKLWAEHQVAEVHEAAKAGAEETKKLGPNAEARKSALERVVGARVPKDQAAALIGDVTSADSLRALETLVASNRGKAPDAPGGRQSFGEMTLNERAAVAAEELSSRKKSA